MKIECVMTVDGNDNLDFTGDDGKAVKLDRSVAYIQFPNARFPEKILINSSLADGDYKCFVEVQAKKDKLSASVDLDSIKAIPAK